MMMPGGRRKRMIMAMWHVGRRQWRTIHMSEAGGGKYRATAEEDKDDGGSNTARGCIN